MAKFAKDIKTSLELHDTFYYFFDTRMLVTAVVSASSSNHVTSMYIHHCMSLTALRVPDRPSVNLSILHLGLSIQLARHIHEKIIIFVLRLMAFQVK
jgi:hypothetical protein